VTNLDWNLFFCPFFIIFLSDKAFVTR